MRGIIVFDKREHKIIETKEKDACVIGDIY